LATGDDDFVQGKKIFYRNGIKLTLEVLAIFLLPTPAVLCGSGDEGRRER
jgi:hypothetical protein